MDFCDAFGIPVLTLTNVKEMCIRDSPNMAQAGGKNPDGIGAAMEEAAKVLEGQIR